MGQFSRTVTLAVVFAVLSVSALPMQDSVPESVAGQEKGTPLMPPMPEMPPVTSKREATASFEHMFKKLAPEDQAKTKNADAIVPEMPPVPATGNQAAMIQNDDVPSPPISEPFEEERKELEEMTDPEIKGKVTTDAIVGQTIHEDQQPAGTVEEEVKKEGEAIAEHEGVATTTAAAHKDPEVADAKDSEAKASETASKQTEVEKIAEATKKSDAPASEQEIAKQAEGVEALAKAQEDANSDDKINQGGGPHPAAPGAPFPNMQAASPHNSAASSTRSITYMTVVLAAVVAMILGNL